MSRFPGHKVIHVNSPNTNSDEKKKKKNIMKISTKYANNTRETRGIITKMKNATSTSSAALDLVIIFLLVLPLAGIVLLWYHGSNHNIEEQHYSNNNLRIVDTQNPSTVGDLKNTLLKLKQKHVHLKLKHEQMFEKLQDQLQYYHEVEEAMEEGRGDDEVNNDDEEAMQEDWDGSDEDDIVLWNDVDFRNYKGEDKADMDELENKKVGKQEDKGVKPVASQNGVGSAVFSTKQQRYNAAQYASRTALLNQFGPGPHQVEVQLDFDPAEKEVLTSDPAPDRFVIEMADVDEMPQAVYLFLQQVDNKLWNGCSFHRNADHILQAGPEANFKTPRGGAKALLDGFEQSGLETLWTQEYSNRYPHVTYTLGLSIRSEDANFYINKRDNSMLHGPLGQASFPFKADPCFARVISGFDTIDRMFKLSVEDDDYEGLNHNVAIRYMKILQKDGLKTPNEGKGAIEANNFKKAKSKMWARHSH